MKKIITFIVAILIVQAVLSGEKLLKAQIFEVITVGETNNIQAQFIDLKDKAIEMGVDEIFINGKVYYTTKGDYQEVKIKWDSIEDTNGLSKKHRAGLKQNFSSKLTTDDEQILPPQKVTIKVDEQILMSALKVLFDKNKKIAEIKLDKESVKQLKQQPTQQNPASGGRGNNSASNLPGADFNTQTEDEITTSIKEVTCPVRYSIEDLRAYEQKSLNTVDSNGNTQNVGDCLDSGVTHQLQKTYGSPCFPLVSESNVYQSYRITGVIAGEERIIRDCQVDVVDNIIPIQITTDQCNYEHHLDLGLSYQTQRRFYELNNEIVRISQCESNAVALQHQETICSYDLEVSPGFAIAQTKIHIDLPDGTESIVQPCVARSTQIPLVKRTCTGTDRYLHDFNASISYLQQETWVNNPLDGATEVKLNDCQISATTYPHLQQESNCARSFEDHNLLTRQATRTYIDDATQTPSKISISECSNGFYDIPYEIGTATLSVDGNTKTRGYIRNDGSNYQAPAEPTETVSFSRSGRWTAPNGVSQIYAILKSGQGGRGPSGCDGAGVAGRPSTIKTLTTKSGNGGRKGGDWRGYLRGCKKRQGHLGTQSSASGLLEVTPGEILVIDLGSRGSGGAMDGSAIIKY